MKSAKIYPAMYILLYYGKTLGEGSNHPKNRCQNNNAEVYMRKERSRLHIRILPGIRLGRQQAFNRIGLNIKHNHFRGSCRMGLLLIILLLLFIPSLIIRANVQNRQRQQQIADQIIRFHVIANSDSDKDQALKLAVKSVLVDRLSPYLKDAASIADARKIISNLQEDITQLARDTIMAQGFSYPVKVSLTECYFPLRLYGEYAFPPGKYEALRVEIGEAKGKNWWCVVFPPLCFVDETCSIIDEDSGQKLKYLLAEEDYEALKTKKMPVKIKFKLLEFFKDLFDKN